MSKENSNELELLINELREMRESLKKLEEIKLLQFTLHRLYAVLRIANQEIIRSFLKEKFRDPVDYLIYQKSDGTKTTRQIAEEIKNEVDDQSLKINKDKVSKKWKSWDSLGLVISCGSQRQKIFDLEDFEI